jgi:hypothetical protein
MIKVFRSVGITIPQHTTTGAGAYAVKVNQCFFQRVTFATVANLDVK